MEVKKIKNLALTVLLMIHQPEKQQKLSQIIGNLIEINRKRKKRVNNQKMSQRSMLLKTWMVRKPSC